jgi:hypothetical protein
MVFRLAAVFNLYVLRGDFLVAEGRIDGEVVAMIKSFRHTGFSVDNSVRIEAEDEAGIVRQAHHKCSAS